MLTLGVTLGAGIGAVTRYVTDQVISHRARGRFPYGTFLINVTGSLLLGLLTGLSVHHGLTRTPTLIIGVGFTGGYTTLSTWAWESLSLAEIGALRAATLNVFGSFAVGALAAAAGLGLAQL
jgi:CrcB protein